MPRLLLLLLLVGCAADPVVVARLTITPTAPTTSDPLVATVEASGPVTLRWSRDGVRTDLTGTTLPPEHTTRGERWSVAAEEDPESPAPAVLIGNAPPTLTLTPNAPPWTADRPPSAVASASDADGDPIAVSFSWTEASGLRLHTAEPTLPARHGWRGQTWTLTAVADDGLTTAEAVHVYEISNAPPALFEFTTLPAAPTRASAWTAVATALDADGDPVELAFRFARGTEILQNSTDPTYNTRDLTRGEAVSVEVIAFDGVETSPWARIDAVVANAPPTVGLATLTPARPNRLDTLTCSAQDLQDSDGDAVEPRFTWWRGAEFVGEGPTLAGTAIRHGDVVYCAAAGFDGVDEGVATWSAPVRMVNTPPILTAATVQPDPPTRAQPLTIALQEPVDLDGDALYLGVRWFINGEEVANTRALSPEYFERGEAVHAEVTATDGELWTDTVATPLVTIANAPPELTLTELSPHIAHHSSVLVATALAGDADGDEVEMAFYWEVDGVVQPETGDALSAAQLPVGSEVRVTITPVDAYGPGASVQLGPVPIVGDLADTTWVEVTPTPALHRDDLTCTPGSVGGLGMPNVQWEVDGVPVDPAELPTDELLGDRVPASLTEVGQTWTCTATWPAGTARAASTLIEQGPPGGNLLLVIADDLGVDKVAAYGEHPDPPVTPTIDSLAAEGVLFRNAYAYPSCSPTRAAMLTGRYARRTGIGRTVEANEADSILSTLEIGLPALLRYSPFYAYTSSAIGKWHIGSEQLPSGLLHPQDMGFDWYAGSFGNLGGGLLEVERRKDYFYWEKVQDAEPVMSEVYTTTDNVDDAIARIASMPQPWLLWLAFTAPHTPVHIPPAELHPYNLGPFAGDYPKYQAMVSALDTELGRLLDTMPPEVRADTTIVFVGDNGTPVHATSAPFLAGRAKTTLYEGGTNVPLIVAGPLVQHPGSEVAALVHVVDILPTFAEIAGVPLNALYGAPTGSGGLVDWPIDGASLLPFLADPSAPGRDYLYTEKFSPNDRFDPANEHQALRDARFKLVVHSDEDDQLFDLSTYGYKDGDNLLSSPLDPVAAEAYERLHTELARLTEEFDADPRP